MTTALNQLTNRLAVDQDGAFPDLVRTLQDGVFSGVLQFTRNRQDAEDATQAVFLVLWKKAASLPNRHSAAGWLHRTTQNVCRGLRGAATCQKPSQYREWLLPFSFYYYSH